MIKLYLLFNKTILKANVPVSILLTILSLLLSFDQKTEHSIIFIVISSFVIWIMTGGFLLSLLYHNLSRKNEYYFYFNVGLTQLKLIGAAYLIHFISITPFFVILYYV